MIKFITKFLRVLYKFECMKRVRICGKTTIDHVRQQWSLFPFSVFSGPKCVTRHMRVQWGCHNAQIMIWVLLINYFNSIYHNRRVVIGNEGVNSSHSQRNYTPAEVNDRHRRLIHVLMRHTMNLSLWKLDFKFLVCSVFFAFSVENIIYTFLIMLWTLVGSFVCT
jgi:hypothetical protein